MSPASVMESLGETRTLVEALLAEQRTLTAVERFARLQDQRQIDLRQRHYRSLLPANAPGPGQQYAFEVDLDKCSGCKACVTACHSLNGLDDAETWRSVGLLIGSEKSEIRNPKSEERSLVPDGNASDFGFRTSFGLRTSDFGLQHITTACHHCADPGCLNGCPVLAYDKDPVTGIVRHLDDQCIGCQYCVMKCPYEVPKYSSRLGIVRKCDMCANRLAVGEAPACVQACPNEAIRIALVERSAKSEDRRPKTERNPKSETRGQSAGSRGSDLGLRDSFGFRVSDFGFPPGSPDSSITLPTTRYLSARGAWAGLQPADGCELRLARAHWPLSLMLVLTQMATGAICVALATRLHVAWLAWAATGAATLGMIAATFHLGQPRKAWRAFLGWRKSWMSRELIAFGGAMPLLAGYALTRNSLLGAAAATAGIMAVFCSAMIYVDTRRAFWSGGITFPKFGLTLLMLGVACAWAAAATAGVANAASGCVLALLVASILKLGCELSLVVRHTGMPHSPLRKTAQLHTGLAGGWFQARLACGVLGGVLAPLAVATDLLPSTVFVAIVSLLLCLAGEILERYLFFICEAAPRMPGGITA